MKKSFMIVVVIAIIAVIAVAAVFLIRPSGCKTMYGEIDNNLKASNYCTQDADCEAIMLGGEYVQFGCYHYINKAIDKQKIYDKMDRYHSRCSQAIDDCTLAPPAICASGKCVSSRE
jgi:hypothetical protein